MRYLRQNGRPELDFLKQYAFADLKTTLDAEMKRLKRAGVGNSKKQAEPLSEEEEEELLWTKGVLGDHSAQALLNTVFFFNGVCFALRSGGEHRELRFKNSQIQLVEKPGKKAYLVYTEDASKNNQGGLKARKTKQKQVTHHQNTENPSRCPIRFYKLYLSKCPTARPDNAFYLKPLKKPTGNCWFTVQPLGHNSLTNMVQNMCKQASILGYKTNHSLRVTTATRLIYAIYASLVDQAGIDEQLIMERTGHRSLDGVRCYKRTEDEQRQMLSDIVNLSAPPVKATKIDSTSTQSSLVLSLQQCSNITINFSTHQ